MDSSIQELGISRSTLKRQEPNIDLQVNFCNGAIQIHLKHNFYLKIKKLAKIQSQVFGNLRKLLVFVLYFHGVSLSAIGNWFGVQKSTVCRWLEIDYE